MPQINGKITKKIQCRKHQRRSWTTAKRGVASPSTGFFSAPHLLERPLREGLGRRATALTTPRFDCFELAPRLLKLRHGVSMSASRTTHHRPHISHHTHTHLNTHTKKSVNTPPTHTPVLITKGSTRTHDHTQHTPTTPHQF